MLLIYLLIDFEKVSDFLFLLDLKWFNFWSVRRSWASITNAEHFESGAEHTVVDPSGDDLVMSNRDVGRGVRRPPEEQEGSNATIVTRSQFGRPSFWNHQSLISETCA